MKWKRSFRLLLRKRLRVNVAAYLERACKEDAEVRAEVEGLLRSHEEAGGFLEQPLFVRRRQSISLSTNPRRDVGRYKLLEEIGEGAWRGVQGRQREPVQARWCAEDHQARQDTGK